MEEQRRTDQEDKTESERRLAAAGEAIRNTALRRQPRGYFSSTDEFKGDGGSPVTPPCDTSSAPKHRIRYK